MVARKLVRSWGAGLVVTQDNMVLMRDGIVAELEAADRAAVKRCAEKAAKCGLSVLANPAEWLKVFKRAED